MEIALTELYLYNVDYNITSAMSNTTRHNANVTTTNTSKKCNNYIVIYKLSFSSATINSLSLTGCLHGCFLEYCKTHKLLLVAGQTC